MSSPVKDRPPPNAFLHMGSSPDDRARFAPSDHPGACTQTTYLLAHCNRQATGFPVASAYQGGAAVGIGVGLDSRPMADHSTREPTLHSMRDKILHLIPDQNGSFDARQNGSFDARPNGGSF
ncbi:hypothetical protein RhiLY_12602 [Ceratobasidium sp. AG-Ba]|nr:hypothetical protein RhiLY_12602 [Ceratobasidium sp. AG-Ba]